MEIPGLGPLTLDESTHWYVSRPVPASALRGAVGRIVLAEDHAADRGPIREAVEAFLSGGAGALNAASGDVFRYYQDAARIVREAGWDRALPQINDPSSVWDYVAFGSTFQVERDPAGEVYVSVECECAWEPEHGLQIVFRRGREVTKVGPFDGHLTNKAALGQEDIADVVYVSPFAV